MKQLVLQPEVFKFNTCADFASGFSLSKNDLILTSESTYNRFLANLNLECHIIFRGKYGAGEPTDLMIDAMLDDVADAEFDRVIAIGGGAVIDMAKILAVANGQKIDYLYDHVAELKRDKDLVIIPTTCGSGSEMTNLSIINRTRMGTKLGLASVEMYATQAVLIPELMSSMPFYVFATSSIDAFIHAVESALSPRATQYSKLFSYKAIDMIVKGYQTIVKEGQDARLALAEDFLIAANYAGIAFGTAGCAAVHATSYLLGGNYHVPHGESNYAMFTGVMEQYLTHRTDGEIAVLSAHLSQLLGCEPQAVFAELEVLLNNVLPKKALHEYGMKEDEVDSFAKTVMATQGRLMGNNFVPLNEDDVREIFQKLY